MLVLPMVFRKYNVSPKFQIFNANFFLIGVFKIGTLITILPFNGCNELTKSAKKITTNNIE